MATSDITQGVVQSLDVDGKGKTFTVAYEVDGVEYLVDAAVSRTPISYKPGDSIHVCFDVSQPSNALMDDFLEKWFIPLLLGGIAVLFAVLDLAKRRLFSC